jgi:VWFA-related protein
MRSLVIIGLGCCCLAAMPARGEDPASAAYTIDIDNQSVVSQVRQGPGPGGLYITLSFKVQRKSDSSIATDVARSEIEVREDGQPVENLEISQPRTRNLTTVLAIDVSGSMASKDKIVQARKAARAFLDRLDERADTGLILFDHRIPENDPQRFQPPIGKPDQYLVHRNHLRTLIDQARPLGGTAYLDAAARAVEMLGKTEGRKAVLLLTDGVDMSSHKKLDEVIALAVRSGVPIYTLGVGPPGKNEQVSTVLVLDTSGSMRAKANGKDRQSKMEALKQATTRFVELMRPTARTTLLPFSSTVGSPGAFSSDKRNLTDRIAQLHAGGGTLLYDATLAGVDTLVAANVTGRKAVVVLTDGKDEAPGSRHSDEEVIERAVEERIPLYLLGLGQARDINEPVMRKMAEKTEGKYYHAVDEEALIHIFEQLSIDLHDDGIDEDSLRKLAEKTGGKYFPARDASRLAQLYEELAEELQSSYTVTFRSRKQSFDGTARGIEVLYRDAVGKVDYAVRGVVVVPDMNPHTYLVLFGFLGGLVLLLALPSRMSRLNSPRSK